jgi:hypothetical protein
VVNSIQTSFVSECMIDLIEAPVAFDRGAGAKWPGRQFIEEEANPILPAATLNARDLTQVLVHYRVPSLGRSIIELAMTVGPSCASAVRRPWLKLFGL